MLGKLLKICPFIGAVNIQEIAFLVGIALSSFAIIGDIHLVENYTYGMEVAMKSINAFASMLTVGSALLGRVEFIPLL